VPQIAPVSKETPVNGILFLGFIGKIQLQVPIRRLKSEHWIITLDKLVLVAGPLTDTEVDSV